jgi:hypothetical protein
MIIRPKIFLKAKILTLISRQKKERKKKEKKNS